jgi:cysteine desulfurase
MLANNETGAIQPVQRLIAELGKGTFFHCDAVQAVGKVAVHFHELGVTTLALSAHKFHGPKGIGALLLRRCTKLPPLMRGGHQQRGRRPGTEPVALAVGLATALDLWQREAVARQEQVLRLRRRFLEVLRDGAAPLVINGPASGGLPHILNVSFPACRGDVLLMNLDLMGVACSTGSACSSGSLLPSHVLRVMGVSEEVLLSALRFSFSPLQAEEEVTEAARRVVAVVGRLRAVGADSSA